MDADLITRWEELVGVQLQAARTLDAPALLAATTERAQVQASLLGELPTAGRDRKERMVAAARRVRSRDLRIQACSSAVIAALDSLAPVAPPPTYTRHARMRAPA